MNIVYGVSGEGLGHAFEAIEIIEILRREAHSVKVFTFGDRASNRLAVFHPTRIEGLSLHVNSRGFSLARSVVNNWRCIPFYLRNWQRLRDELRTFHPDVFITSYEPFTTIVSHWMHKSLISMDNQNELLYIKKPRGSPTIHFKLAQWLTRIFTYRASYYIVKSRTKIETGKKNVYFVSSHIQNEIRSLSPTTGEHILVYLTKPNQNLIKILKLIPEEQVYNAYFLRESGLGEFSLNVTKYELEQFLSNLAIYQNRFAQYQINPDEQKEILLMILENIKNIQSFREK
jgi:uncharacterized protein (TIGR00661 family)